MTAHLGRKYIIKALQYLGEDDAHLVRLRFGLIGGKPVSIADLAQMFNVSHGEMSMKLRSLEKKAIEKARELEDSDR